MNAMLFAIGDVHGHFDKLMALMAHCRRHAHDLGEEARFVLLGDYVDRGPHSKSVLAYLAGAPADVVAIRGNHEDMLLRALDDRDAEAHWHYNGGLETLASYGTADVRQLPEAHLDLLRRLPLYVDDGVRLFVHAGIDPADPSARDPNILLWTRKHAPDEADLPRFIVHGHTPTASHRPDLRPNRLNLDTGAGYGHALTAAAFDTRRRGPAAFLNHLGETATNSPELGVPAASKR
jgi:serine/threonine protein phosphatase 1